MPTTERAKSEVIRLSYADGKVIVEPEDEDRFVLTAQSAVKACQDMQKHQEAIKLFKETLILPIRKWCKEHIEKVSRSYIPSPSADYVQVFIIGTSEVYDFDLGQEVSALELSLAENGWKTNVIQLPAIENDDLQTYFETRNALEVNAEFETTSGKGKA